MGLLDDLKKIGAEALGEGIKSLGDGLNKLSKTVADDLNKTQQKPPTQQIKVEVTKKDNG